MKYYKIKWLTFKSFVLFQNLIYPAIFSAKYPKSLLQKFELLGKCSKTDSDKIPPAGVYSVHFPFSRINNKIFYKYQPPDVVGWNVFRYGFLPWENEVGVIFSRLVQEASSFLDIGANTGLYSLLASSLNPNCVVHAFEPNPNVYKKLLHNIQINKFTNVITHELAISNIEVEGQLHVPIEASMASLNLDGFRSLPGKIYNVSIKKLDSFLGIIENIDLIKIDVEGFEPYVLKGADSIISKYKPTIILECNPDGPADELDAFAKKYDYSLYHPNKGIVSNIATIKSALKSNAHNFIMVQESKKNHMAIINQINKPTR